MKKTSMIIVDSRKHDPQSEVVLKHEGIGSVPNSYKPVRKIHPEIDKLSPLARFMVENEDGTYIGGFLHRKNNVRVEGPIGSHPAAGDRMYGIPVNERAVCQGWLFPVFEPNFNETEYFNAAAEKIEELAGKGGRVIIHKNIFEVA